MIRPIKALGPGSTTYGSAGLQVGRPVRRWVLECLYRPLGFDVGYLKWEVSATARTVLDYKPQTGGRHEVFGAA